MLWSSISINEYIMWPASLLSF